MVQVYSVTPESLTPDDERGVSLHNRLAHTVRAAETMGCHGMLVPQNMQEIDPWMVACQIGSLSSTLTPLIAVQPACVSPHTAAAAAAAYALLFSRPLYFNLVAGARNDELLQIGDTLDHDQRYERLRAFARLTRGLLDGERVTGDGHFYHYLDFRLQPCPDVLKECRFFVAGSSTASRSVAAEADVVITHPAPVGDWLDGSITPLRTGGYTGAVGIRIGIVCRPDSKEAWEVADRRFPESWVGTQETKLKTLSTNSWSRDLAQRVMRDHGAEGARDPYWLGAFKSGRASAPFLVGNYREVADRLSQYVDGGVEHIVLNAVVDEDYEHVRNALRMVEPARE
jgi:alkanesulfonate monooxygenase SsuD/methylene tetrahydromethanopterin reductase-like flavin-dependent oxidoreductase (luciferase family)